MRLTRLERALPDGTCNAGKVFYACGANNFRGCCSVDPCALPACPDTDLSSTSTALVTSRTSSQATTRQTLSSILTSALSSTLAASTSTTTVSPTPILNDAATNTSSTSSQSQTSSPTHLPPSSGNSNTPIIAGAVSGFVGLSILSVLIWFCLRRRNHKRESRDPIAQYGLPSKESVLNRSTPSESLRFAGDIFAQFGGESPKITTSSKSDSLSALGRYNEPHLTRATPSLPSGHSTPKQAPTSSLEVAQSAAAASNPTTPITDKPLPDPEKSALAPPPAHEHPFFHPLPGQSSEIPIYHPGTPVHPNLTPIISPSPKPSTMSSHPAYHVSQLHQHPAFRPSKPASPPRESGFPRRTPEVRRHHSFSPTQRPQQTYAPAWRCSELSGASPITSPILGRSELEAEIPARYRTPAPTSYFHNNHHDITNTHSQNDISISRGNTDSSKYSIPIGLGVDPSFHPPSNHREFGSDLQHKDSSSIPSLSISTQMIGPLGPNLNSPRDGGYIMSWATEGYCHGKMKGRGDRQERRVECSDEKEVVSPMSPERWSGATVVHSPGNTVMSAESGTSSGGLSPEAGTGTWGSWSGR